MILVWSVTAEMAVFFTKCHEAMHTQNSFFFARRNSRNIFEVPCSLVSSSRIQCVSYAEADQVYILNLAILTHIHASYQFHVQQPNQGEPLLVAAPSGKPPHVRHSDTRYLIAEFRRLTRSGNPLHHINVETSSGAENHVIWAYNFNPAVVNGERVFTYHGLQNRGAYSINFLDGTSGPIPTISFNAKVIHGSAMFLW
jgi:hypothetical protein